MKNALPALKLKPRLKLPVADVVVAVALVVRVPAVLAEQPSVVFRIVRKEPERDKRT
jgi:hypothetical protein